MISDIEKQISGIIPLRHHPSGHDYAIRPNWIDLGFDFNSIPFHSDVAIIVTSWWGHLHFLEATLTNYRLTGKYVLCSYDTPFWPREGSSSFNNKMPSDKIWSIPHAWVFKHRTFDNEKRNGWLWDMFYANGILKNLPNFKYVFHVNGDCIWEKVDGVDDLINELGEDDLMSISSQPNSIHTCAVIYRRESFFKVFDYIFEFLREPVLGSRSPEHLLTEAVRFLHLKEKVAPVQPIELSDSSVDHYSRFNQDSTWKRGVGYRNLGSEFLACLIERTEPPPGKYIDLEMMKIICPGFSNSLFEFYKTKDRRFLYQAWDHNEDSWHDRVWYPIEYYGSEPIYEIDPENKFELTKTII